MKTDFHYHPSLFSRGDRPHITELTTPSLEDIQSEMLRKNVGLLTITSCSTKDHIDRRWNAYQQEANEDLFDDLTRQSIRFSNGTHIIHGQELKTNKGDINVLFAEQRVPIEKSNGDFYRVLDAAKDCGENVLIGINQVSSCAVPTYRLRELHEQEKIDFLESYNAFDFSKNNKLAQKIAEETGIPGIAVSDGHRLEDMAKAYILISPPSLNADYTDLAKHVKEQISQRNYQSFQGHVSLTSKGLYLARLANAIADSKLPFNI